MDPNRRDFAKTLAVGAAGAFLPASSAFGQKLPTQMIPEMRSTFRGVPLGVNTYSLPDVPLDDAIRAFAGIGFGMAELHPCHAEAGSGVRGGGGDTTTREKLRQWRLTVPLEQFEEMGKKFRSAGLYLYAYNTNFRDDFTDAEIDRAFQMTHALGCSVMTAVGSKKLFRRLDPFAQKYKIWAAVHNEGDSIPTIADFDEVLRGASPYTRMTLDVGHFVASNSDPLACLESHHDRILDLHVKDRRKSNGPNLAFGTGDTPIREVLRMDRDRKFGIPVQIEWEVPSDKRVEAVRNCFEYCKHALES